ncbi:MAG: fasciclin domain-containing protein [Salinibacter sp.]|uniref:fasciclin domain-containing protein n=1 Tax=Salinibacter sp. TaxID=2065818 RepID=UPI002FC31913
MSTVQKKAPSVVDIATNDKNFSTLVSALQAAGLVDTLKGDGPFTVFAPTNAAFEDLSESVLEDLMKPTNKTRLQNLLKNHVIEGRRMAKDVAESSSLTPMSGKRLRIRTNEDQQVRIGDATVRQTDLDAENGIVHVIDRVLR